MSYKRELAKESAFPFHDGFVQGGMTKREYFAGLAMQGMLHNSTNIGFDTCADAAVKYADALLLALEKSP